jgi:hypothetical protein
MSLRLPPHRLYSRRCFLRRGKQGKLRRALPIRVIRACRAVASRVGGAIRG